MPRLCLPELPCKKNVPWQTKSSMARCSTDSELVEVVVILHQLDLLRILFKNSEKQLTLKIELMKEIFIKILVMGFHKVIQNASAFIK